jgi:hypothetical protein
MTPGVGFVSFLVVTLAFLGGVVASGRAANRKLHFPLVAGAVLSLGVTIYYAEKLGELYNLDAAGSITPIHLMIAKITTVAYLFPLVLGPITVKKPEWLTWHRRAAYLVLALTVLAAATGMTMILLAERLPG